MTLRLNMHSADCIVVSARSWVGTAFAHQGRRKACGADPGGVDCLGLLVGVAAECGLARNGRPLAACDRRDYGHYPDEQRLYEALARYLTAMPPAALQSGDVCLMRIDATARHLGIVGQYRPAAGSPQPHYLTLIHAYAPARRVVEHRLDAQWRERVVAVFRLIADDRT